MKSPDEVTEDDNFDEVELSRSLEDQVTQSGDHRLETAKNSYCLDQISGDDLCSSLCPKTNITESQDNQENMDGDVVLNATDDLKLNVEMGIPKDEENRQTAKKDKFEQMEYYDKSANDNNYARDKKDKFEQMEDCDISAYTGSVRDNLYEVPIEEEKANEAGCFFCPRITPVPFCVFVFLTIFAAIPAASYIILFTKIGIGLDVFSFIDTELKPFSDYVGGVVLVYGAILYFIDIHYWKSYSTIVLRRYLLFVLAAGLLLFVICISGDHPYGPVGIILIITTAWMVSIRFLFFRNVEKREYISWLSGPILLVSLVVALYWFIWTFLKEENEWTLINSLMHAEKAGCDPNFVTYPQCEAGDGEACFEVDEKNYRITFGKNCDEACTDIYDSCPNTFIIWAGPFLVSLGFFFLSFFASFLRSDGSAEQSIGKLAKIWMFLLFSIWVSSSLAGAGAGVSATLAALTLGAFVASAIFLVAGFDQFEREEQAILIWANIVEKYASVLDPVRGLLIVTCTPIAACYILVSVFKQLIRNCKCCAGNSPPTNTESLRNVTGGACLTVEARRLVRLVASWDTAKVFTYAIYWGIGFMIMMVIVSEFTIVFLSWLIEETLEMSIAAVTGILAAVGLIMFLLPPVPGVPIYLTLGIVIVPVGREVLGITGSIVYAMVISLCLKLMACTIQQKLIGGQLQNLVSVRQFVGVNSKVIKAMKLVLERKGLGIAKVAILIGGPDWPTSVLCGIMDLPLVPILIGTLPIVLLILPTLLTGSFTYMAGLRIDGQQEFPWATTLATVSLAITSLVQFGSMIVAAFYIESTVSTRGKELDDLPIDIEVKEADDKVEVLNKAYDEVVQWQCVPKVLKLVLCLSLACMIVCCYMVQLFADNCFAEYQLTYTIDEHLNGDWKNIVLPLGGVALILFATSIVFLSIFTTWAKRGARKQSLSISETAH